MSTNFTSRSSLLAVLSILAAIAAFLFVSNIRAKGLQGSVDGVSSLTGRTILVDSDDPRGNPPGISASDDIKSWMAFRPLIAESIEGRIKLSAFVELADKMHDANYIWSMHLFEGSDRERKTPVFEHFYLNQMFDLNGRETMLAPFTEFLSLEPGDYILAVRLTKVSNQLGLDELADLSIKKMPMVSRSTYVSIPPR